jgi:hypothetical protein
MFRNVIYCGHYFLLLFLPQSIWNTNKERCGKLLLQILWLKYGHFLPGRERASERESECGCVFQRAPNECEISRHHSTPPTTHPTTLDVPLSINMKYYHLITTN